MRDGKVGRVDPETGEFVEGGGGRAGERLQSRIDRTRRKKKDEDASPVDELAEITEGVSGIVEGLESPQARDFAGFGAAEAGARRVEQQGGQFGMLGLEQARAAQEGQRGLVSQLQAQAAGTAPSLAQLQQEQAFGQAITGQAALAGGQRGNPALAQRIAAQSGAGLMAQQAQQSGILRLQEQQQAQQALAGVLAQQQAGGAQFGGLGIQSGLGAGGLQSALADQERQAARQPVEDILTLATGERGLQSQEELARRQQNMALAGAAIQGVGAAIPSDERVKTDISNATEDDLSELFGKLQPSKYRYTDDAPAGAGPGERIGIMAQDLERSRLGKNLVREIHGVKHIDVGGLVGTLVASEAERRRREAKERGDA